MSASILGALSSSFTEAFCPKGRASLLMVVRPIARHLGVV